MPAILEIAGIYCSTVCISFGRKVTKSPWQRAVRKAEVDIGNFDIASADFIEPYYGYTLMSHTSDLLKHFEIYMYMKETLNSSSSDQMYR